MTGEGVEVIEQMDASWVKLVADGLTVVVPNEIPTVERLSNNGLEPKHKGVHLDERTNEHSQVMLQVSSNDGVGAGKWGDPHSVDSVTETVSLASGLIDVELL